MTRASTVILAHRSREGFLRIAALVAVIYLLVITTAAVHIARHGSEVKDLGWTAAPRNEAWVVMAVDAGGPAQDLQPGDKLVAIDGDPTVQRIGPAWILRDSPERNSYSITIDRGGRKITETLAWPVRTVPGLATWLWIHLVTCTVYVVVGLLIAFGKPESLVARRAVLSSVLGAALFSTVAFNPNSGTIGGWMLAVALLGFAIRPFHIVTGYRFNAAFPLEQPSKGGWRVFERIIYAFGFLIWLPAFYGGLLRSFGPARAAHIVAAQYPFSLYHDGLVDVANILMAAVVSVANVLVVWRNYRALTDVDLRRRMRWVSIGVAAGMIPILLAAPLLVIGYAAGKRVDLVTIVRVINTITIIIPLSVGYAILKHRVLGIRVILRAGLRYLLARNVLRAAIALPIAISLYTLVTHRSASLADLLTGPAGRFNVNWLALAGAGLLFRRPLLRWIDRRFFREAYQQDQIFLALAEGIGRAADVTEISRLLSTQIQAALHPRSIFAASCESNDEFATLYSSSGKGDQRKLSSFHLTPSDFAGLSAATDVTEVGRLSPSALGSMSALGIVLLVPILGPNEGLVGLILLGEKQSEEPYTRNDRRLLDTTASQTGVVWENLRLRARLKREQSVRRDVVAQMAGGTAEMLMECETCGTCYDSTVTVCPADGRELSPSLPVSRILDGKYLIERVIGRGGMGAVYEATDLRLGRKVAVKVTPGTVFADAITMERFGREARASAKLDHPNVVRAFDYGELPSCAYLVLEHLPGATLRRELQRRGRLPVNEARRIVEQITAGLASAHARHVVHRDIKPENIFLARIDGVGEPVVKILDFGLAIVRDAGFEDRNRLTQTGAAVGTLGYMSVEQFLGERVDERADIYSLGVVMLEMLTGEIASRGPTFGRIGAIVDERLGGPGNSAGEREIARVLRRALEEKREDRYSSIGEFRDAILAALDNCPSVAGDGGVRSFPNALPGIRS